MSSIGSLPVSSTARRLPPRATGSDRLGPHLERLRINGDSWIETVQRFGRWFKRVVGRRESLKTFAERTGRRWFQGQRAAAVAFL